MTSFTPVDICSDWNSSEFDGVIVVASSVDDVTFEPLRLPLKSVCEVDRNAETGVFLIPAPLNLNIKRIVFSGIGPLDKDYDDVRSYAVAADMGVSRAISAGCRSPVLFLSPIKDSSRFPQALLVSILGAMKALYVPLEVREDLPKRAKKLDRLSLFFAPGTDGALAKLELARALEQGRIVSRDIGGSDPERMAAPRVEEYIRQTFADTCIRIEVIQGQSVFEKEYPCFAAVNRAASSIPRHDGRVIWLTYEEGKAEKTLFLVGKGVTYDTGGADIKAGGIMAGMSRDKCGAAAVAGVLKAISVLKPKGVKVVGAMCMVRNSVGEDCYVADEIITSRAGVRLRVGNTDAEGRMAMADVLCHAKEKALSEINPHLMTIATLTGHQYFAHGPYTGVMDNGPAEKELFSRRLQKTGGDLADCFEVSTIRKEDFDFIKDKSGEFVDVLQNPNTPSSTTQRGHQIPAAFLQVVSGLDKHMLTSAKPLKYSHLDVAGSSGDLPDITTAATVVALTMNAME